MTRTTRARIPRYRSPFITFEGGEGTGKTTQASLLRDKLTRQGYSVDLVREPGTTRIGNQIRKIVKHQDAQYNTTTTDALLFMAARAQLVHDVISKSLELGIIVIADRYSDSTLAYQGYGLETDVELLSKANELAIKGYKPDMTFLLDMPVGESLERRNRADADDLIRDNNRKTETISQNRNLHRFEDMLPQFHYRVADGYRELARQDPQRWITIDASEKHQLEVAREVWEHVSLFWQEKWDIG